MSNKVLYNLDETIVNDAIGGHWTQRDLGSVLRYLREKGIIQKTWSLESIIKFPSKTYMFCFSSIETEPTKPKTLEEKVITLEKQVKKLFSMVRSKSNDEPDLFGEFV